MKSNGLYIHIPFCVRKCAYCDFYSLPGKQALISPYIDAVLAEAGAYAGMSCETLYIGGGTPSLLGPGGLKKLMDGLRGKLDCSHLDEATLEVNPELTTPELLTAAKALGFNRISIGVQSLNDSELQSAGRIHNAEQALQVIRYVKQAGMERVSADIIVGLPGQDWTSLKNTLETLVGLELNHTSVYCLSLEEGTPLYEHPPENLPSDDVQAELFERASDFLAGNGFIHYEISNFARPGQECRHNLNYWRGGEYLGLGAGAASHLNGKRFKNGNNLETYIQNPTGMITDIEELGLPEKASEEAMLRLRLLVEGLSPDDIARRFGWENCRHLLTRLDRMAQEGVLISDGTRYRLPPSRILTANPVFARVLSD